MAGDSKNTPAVSNFDCQQCGAPVAIRASGFTVTVVCPSCGSLSEIDNGNFILVQRSVELLKIKPRIVLGTKGKMRGCVYQVIGFMRRYEREYADQPWDEYLLYNPYQGYRWLMEYKGHWTLFKATKSVPQKVTDRSVSFIGSTFQDYHQGNAVVQFVLGEFYWRVRAADSVRTRDLIKPPFMLSQEIDGREVNWSLGEYVEPAEVLDAFHPDPMPEKEGIAPNQPSVVKGLRQYCTVWLAAIVVIFSVQIFGTSIKPLKIIEGKRVTVPETGLSDIEVAQFSTASSSTHVEINVTAFVDQSWATVGLSILPVEGTNQTPAHRFEKDISFYSGYDDGYWSEGSKSEDFLINALPRGNYRVLLTVTPEKGHSVDILAKVKVSPTVWSNCWLAIFLITLPIVWLSFRSRVFETKRWSDSEFNPFAKREEQ